MRLVPVRSGGVLSVGRGPLGLGILLGVVVLLQLIMTVGVLQFPAEVMYGEAIVFDHAARIVRGEPLYQRLDGPPYTVAAYTPLYYWLAAGLQAVFGLSFGPGRALSILAGLTATMLIGYLAARILLDRRAGVFPALLFLALGLPGGAPWYSLYKEDMLGVALAVGAVATLLSGTSRRHVLAAGLLAGLAIMTKQTLVAPTLAGGVWLWRQQRSSALLFVATSAAITLGTSVILEATTGAFLANTVFANVNPFRLEALGPNLATLALFQAAPLALAGSYVLGQRRLSGKQADRLLSLYWCASMLPLIGESQLLDGARRQHRRAGDTPNLAGAHRVDRRG
jgi:4-amino-4-deoxy-L-arabinose transferase-like glycosyltransferase